ncbi:terminase small subunit [Lysinibacillus sphaericus]|uniref:terminase small subunit n=1 Tax=Lysinibacillus sphaericus TaxID=1421 RepID=UPI00216383E4|nr:terminase small subunit [Lysinibacillus sphaericus]MCS1383566.1 terminase small subunit [Lysinibacillus sphaericus]
MKQQAWADYYIESGNATDAAIKAGYSKKTAKQIGTENLAKPILSEYIQKKIEELSSERIADATEVMEYLTSVMRREHKEVVPVTLMSETSKWVDGKKQTIKEESVELVEIPAKLSDANKAAELLGKRYRMWIDKVETDGKTKVVIVDDV